jgi:hypothetical protein
MTCGRPHPEALKCTQCEELIGKGMTIENQLLAWAKHVKDTHHISFVGVSFVGRMVMGDE